jgi:hypothetical protein
MRPHTATWPDMIGRSRGTIAVLAALAAPSMAHPLLAAPGGADSTFHFRYAPRDGFHEISTLAVTSEKDLGALGRVSDRRVYRTAWDYRREANGFTVTARTISAEATRNGKPYPDAMLDVMRRIPLVYHVGPDGGLRSIDGLAGVIDTLKHHHPPEVVKALAPVLSHEAVFAREAAEWNGRYQDYHDAVLAVGDRIETRVPFTLPSGDTLSYRMIISIAGRESCASGTCARIQVVYDSDLAAVDRMLTQMSGDLFHALGDSLGPSSSGTRISGTISRLVDPSTLRICGETSKRVLGMTIRVPGHDPVQGVMTETRVYTFSER